MSGFTGWPPSRTFPKFEIIWDARNGRIPWMENPRCNRSSRHSSPPSGHPAPQPPLGFSFWAHQVADLGEQFCTDGYGQGVQAGMSEHGRVLMSETDQFWEYAKEAML